MIAERVHAVAAITEVRRLWAEGATPSALLRELQSRGIQGGDLIAVMRWAFSLGISTTHAISAWLSAPDDELVDQYLGRDMPARTAAFDD